MAIQGHAKMNIVFRCDASLQIGTGHVVRCLTLADALQKNGANCHFICRPHKGNLINLIRQRGHKCSALPEITGTTWSNTGEVLTNYTSWLGTTWRIDAADTINAIGTEQVDWLVVDHYALDERWERQIRPACKKIMVIDDLADRRHDCDLLLDQNLGHEEQDYVELVPNHSIRLCGPKFALLRREFAKLRPTSLARRREQPQLRRILISMGGIDQDNFTGKILTTLEQYNLPKDLEFIVVMGQHAPWLDEVRQQVSNIHLNCKLKVNVENMAKLMAATDLAIGAAGSTTWERCCLGVPTIQFVLAENQIGIAKALNSINAVVESTIDTFPKALSTILSKNGPEKQKLRELSSQASTVTDGRGVEIIIDLLKEEVG